MMKHIRCGIGIFTLLISCILASGLAMAAEETQSAANKTIIPVSSLDLNLMSLTFIPGIPLKRPLSINGQKFDDGIWMCAHGFMHIQLDGHGTKFTAKVGVDDSIPLYMIDMKQAAVVFYVQGDGRDLWKSPVMTPDSPPLPVSVDITGIKKLALLALPVHRNYPANIADWAEAQLETDGYQPQAVSPEREADEIVTPKPSLSPHINAPRVYGARPGHPFQFLLPVSGERPMKYKAKRLPKGLALDEDTGIITGVAKKAGTYKVKIIATNSHGKDTNTLRVVIGDTIALTPPMGFNDWYSYGLNIDQDTILDCARAMVDSTMSQYGYTYIGIDDSWMVKPGQGYEVLADDSHYADSKTFKEMLNNTYKLVPGESEPGHGEPRDEQGRINANPKFPDMKAMNDQIHAMGLKTGIYSSPGPITCAGFVGSYLYEDQDAQRFAEWGFDLLKYDWCYYGWRWAPELPSPDQMKEPFIRMNEAIKKQPRDILFNLCQYGLGDIWEWGAAAGGQSWRTGNDIAAVTTHNSYYSNFVSVALSEIGLEKWAGPGHWNDPDFLVLGKPFNVSSNEAYSHMTFWTMLCAPLFFTGRMDKLEEHTLNVLCNPEVLEVNLDPLGQQARMAKREDYRCVLVKDLEDGSKAVGLFNIGEIETTVKVNWEDLGITGPMKVRDLWRQKDLGVFDKQFEKTVPRHGVFLVRISPADKPAKKK